MKLAAQIKQARIEEGLTQEQLADKVGMFKANISRIEAGRQGITFDTLEKLSQALNRELEILLHKKP